MSLLDKPMAEVLGADTLLVIGDNECVEGAIEGVVNEVRELSEEGVRVGGVVIEIESENLMIVSDDADFGSSRVRGEDEAAGIDFMAIEELHECLTVVVLTDEASEYRGGAEGSEATSDVSCATRGRIAAVDLGDGDGSV